MRALLLTPDQQWADDVANAICDEDCASHRTLLCCAADVGHGYDDRLADYRAESADYGVASDWGGCVVCPFRLPDHGAAGYDGKAVYDEENDPYVGYARGEIAAEEDRDEADETERELPEDGRERRPAESVYDQWAETRNCAVDSVRATHEQEHEVELHIRDALPELIHLDLLTPHTRRALPQPFNSDNAFALVQEPCFSAGIGDKEAEASEEEG